MIINAGDQMIFRCLHADGQWYRRWQSTIESISETQIVTYSPPNGWAESASSGVIHLPHAIRAFYWPDRFFNLDEVFDADGNLIEIYINVASPLQTVGEELHYIDYELDVLKFPGQPAFIIDQDEFEEAIALYGYSPEFQAQCWQAAEEARLFAEAWMA